MQITTRKLWAYVSGPKIDYGRKWGVVFGFLLNPRVTDKGCPTGSCRFDGSLSRDGFRRIRFSDSELSYGGEA